MLSTEKGPNPELQVFQKKMVALAGLLQCQVASIATACHDRGLIALDEMTIITNPGAMHSKYSIDKILTDVGQKIKEDPKNLELFVASVLEPMGKFADNLVCSLSKYATIVIIMIMNYCRLDFSPTHRKTCVILGRQLQE